MMLGEMEVHGMPPPKFAKALAVIAACLHDNFDKQPWIKPEWSRKSCVLASLAVRDFLWKLGFKDAAVVSVMFMIRAWRAGEEVHSLGIGVTDDPRQPDFIPGHWNGHMAVRVPSVGYLIDTTLFQAVRPQWPDLPGMLAVPLCETRDRELVRRRMVIAGMESEPDRDTVVQALWLHSPENDGWRRSDGVNDADRGRRAPVVKKLVEQFGKWKD